MSVLDTKRVLITGASRGIGRDMALAFAAAGAQVAICARSRSQLAVVSEAVGGDTTALACDVSDSQQVERLREHVLKKWTAVDILINNAGVAGSHKFIGHPDQLWHDMLAVNLTGTYLVTKAFAAPMLEQKWGRIINIASVAAKSGGKYIAAYAASKHGVLGLTRALAAEFAPYITVNAICPAYVDTPMTDEAISNIVARTGMTGEQARARLVESNYQKRLIRPEEVSALAVFLAGENSHGITGQAISVDGGMVRST